MSNRHLVRVETSGARKSGSGRSCTALVLGSLALALQALAVEPDGWSAAAPAAVPVPPPAVTQTTEVFEVEQLLDGAGRVERRLVPAADLVAGDELRYLIRLRNEGPARVEAGRIQVQTPVPEGVRFLPGSAGGAGALVEYALDGMTFSAYVPDQPAETAATAASTGDALAAELAVPVSASTSTAPEMQSATAPAGGQQAVESSSAAPQAAAVAAESMAAETPATEAAVNATTESGAAGAGPTPDAPSGAAVGIEARTEAHPEAESAGVPAPALLESAAVAGAEAELPEAVAAEAPTLTIRWTYQQPLDPGAVTEVFFHVRLL